MPVEQRVAAWAMCGVFCAFSTTMAAAQESFIRQHPVETVVSPRTPNPVPQDRNDNNGDTSNSPDDNGAGLRLGSFVLTNSHEAGLDYTDNALSSETNKSSDRIFSINSSLAIESDWSRHSLRFGLDTTREFYEKNSSEDSVSVNAEARMRIDIRRDTNLDLRMGFTLGQESRGSVDLDTSAESPSDIYAFSASAALNHRINRTTMSLRGGISLYDYEDTRLSNGTVADNSDRNYYEVNTTLRVGYDISPRLIVFSELSYAENIHDRRVDDNGEVRDSHSYGASAGVAFAVSDLVNGEVSIGYREAVFDDSSFDNVDALVVNASLTWIPSELTEITASLSTDLGETTLGGSSSAVTRTASLSLTHAWRENIELNASGSVELNKFNGLSRKETTYNASLGVDYELGRKMTLGARYSYVKFDSSTAGEDYETNTVGVRLTYAD